MKCTRLVFPFLGLCEYLYFLFDLLHVDIHVIWAGARGALTCAKMGVDMLGESWGILHSPEINNTSDR